MCSVGTRSDTSHLFFQQLKGHGALYWRACSSFCNLDEVSVIWGGELTGG